MKLENRFYPTFILVLLLAACGTEKSDRPEAAGRVMEEEIQLSESGPSPSYLQIEPGTQVSWINRSQQPIVLQSLEQTWEDELIAPGASFFYLFSSSGIFKFQVFPQASEPTSAGAGTIEVSRTSTDSGTPARPTRPPTGPGSGTESAIE